MKRIRRVVLMKLLAAAEFGIRTSGSPEGRRLGGHDIPNVPDRYIVLTIGLSGVASFIGHWQSA